MIWVAPNCRVASATGPAAWVSGATTRFTGSSVRPPIALPTVSIIVPQPRLVTLTPLDGPVVPPVGKMPTISSRLQNGSLGSCQLSASAPAMNSSSDGSPSWALSRQTKFRSDGTRAFSSATSSAMLLW